MHVDISIRRSNSVLLENLFSFEIKTMKTPLLNALSLRITSAKYTRNQVQPFF